MSRRRQLCAIAASALLFSGCSSTDSSDTVDEAAAATAASTPDAAATPSASCEQGLTGDLGGASAVDGVASDWTITSFDGTDIRAHWFPTADGGAEGAPTVLMGPGWSLPGETSMEGSPIFGSLGIGRLLEEGYNVLTWDPRGFGVSSGTVNINSAEFEGRDVQVLLDWVSAQDGVQLDRDGDPRVGMIGASYGGGIQLVTAAIDCRVDAIVPNMAWNSLTSSLYRNETFKRGWADQLTGFAATASLDPHILSAASAVENSGRLSDEDIAWFTERGPADLVADISVPTLLLGGTVDTLFTLDETIANFELLDETDTTVSMRWYCGGHGVCLTTPNPDLTWMADATVDWLNRWVKGDESVDLGERVTVMDQHGNRYGAEDYPDTADRELRGSLAGGPATLALQPTPHDPIAAPPGDILGGIVAGITPSPAHRAIEVEVRADGEALVVGAPTIAMTYRGTAGEGVDPTRVFAQLVDPVSRTVLGGQVTPIPVTLDGAEHTVEIALESIGHLLGGGDTLLVQLIATTPAYATPRLGGTLTVDSLEIGLPIRSVFTAGSR